MPLSLKALITRRVLGWEEIPDQPPRLKIVTETGWITARGGGGGEWGRNVNSGRDICQDAKTKSVRKFKFLSSICVLAQTEKKVQLELELRISAM